MDKCFLCKSALKDDIKYGEFLTRNGMSVHTICLYLTSNLAQEGGDDEGFFGFLHEDITLEQKRISRLKCCYCGEKYANIGCCEVKCKRSFHTICGLENGIENQFTGTYQSYCHQHIHSVKYRPARNENCCICYDSLKGPKERFDTINMLRAPCCKNGWFHKLCLQTFAKTSGYFFKCPLCNDVDVFRRQLSMKGIFIPNCDAAWELEPNAFAELLERPSTCSAAACVNKKGRTENSERDPLLVCGSCGSIAIHQRCLPNGRGRNFHCDDCKSMIGEDSGCGSVESPPPGCSKENQTDDEDMEVDVCNISSEEEDEEDEIKMVRKNQSRPLRLNDYDEEREEMPVTRVQLPTKTQSTAQYSSEDSSSDEEDTQALHYRKIRVLITNKIPILIDSDEDSDNSVLSAKRSKMHSSTNKSTDIWSSDDDDPLENFTTFVEKKKQNESHEVPKLPKVKIRKLKIPTNSQGSSQGYASSHQDQDQDQSLDVDENVPPTKGPLEVSCIAGRTRRRSGVKKSIDNTEPTPVQSSEVRLNSPEKPSKGIHEDEASCSSSSTVTNFESENDSGSNHQRTTRPPTALEVSCIARRTRRKSIYHNSPDNFTELVPAQPSTTVVDRSNDDEATDCPKARNCETEKDSGNDSTKVRFPANESSRALDISCIAKRTRRKSIYQNPTDNAAEFTSPHSSQEQIQLHVNNVVDLATDNEATNCYLTKARNSELEPDSENVSTNGQLPAESALNEPSRALDISCIAKRTRRKSSLNEYSMKNVPQYVDVHERECSQDSCTSAHKRFKSATATNDNDDDTDSVSSYKTASENESPLEISCVAKRTRHRTSLNHYDGPNLDQIAEEETSSHNSSLTGASSFKSARLSQSSSMVSLSPAPSSSASYSARKSRLKLLAAKRMLVTLSSPSPPSSSSPVIINISDDEQLDSPTVSSDECRQRLSSPSLIINISDDQQSDSPTISSVYSPPLRSRPAYKNGEVDPYLMPKFRRIGGKLKRDIPCAAHLKSTPHSNGR